MFENPMEMYNPYSATTNVDKMHKQREKMDCNCHAQNYYKDEKREDNHQNMPTNSSYKDDYMMDKKREMKYYNDYYMMKNGNNNDNYGMDYKMKDDMNNGSHNDNYGMDHKMKDDMNNGSHNDNYGMDHKMKHDMENSNHDDNYGMDHKMKNNMDDMMNYGKMPNMENADNKDMMGMLICTHTPPLPADPQMTMAYVPYQDKSILYSDEMALQQGTMFEALDKPFRGWSV